MYTKLNRPPLIDINKREWINIYTYLYPYLQCAIHTQKHKHIEWHCTLCHKTVYVRDKKLRTIYPAIHFNSCLIYRLISKYRQKLLYAFPFHFLPFPSLLFSSLFSHTVVPLSSLQCSQMCIRTGLSCVWRI